MTKQELSNNVITVVRSTLRLDPKREVLPSTLLVSELGAESIDMLDLACDLERITHCSLDFHKMLQEHREQGKPDDFSVEEIVDAIAAQVEVESEVVTS